MDERSREREQTEMTDESIDLADIMAALKKLDPKQAEFFAELLEPEPLHPHLRPYLYDDEYFGSMLKHPLVFSLIHTPAHNKSVNLQYEQKQKMTKEAVARYDWNTYVFLHERPYRVDAFMEVENRLTNSEYWSLFSSIWMDSENIRENPREWEMLLNSNRTFRECMMDEEEQQALAELPDVIDIYQGHTDIRDDGWSWTTDRAKAEWFAGRFSSLEGAEAFLTIAKVNKADVYAYLLSRGEREIIANPATITMIESHQLTQKESDHHEIG
jgi:hypothetical protein